MNNEDSSQERSIFLAASKLPEKDVRDAFLDAACGSDTALRKRLDKLLACEFVAGPNPLQAVVDELAGPVVSGEPETEGKALDDSTPPAGEKFNETKTRIGSDVSSLPPIGPYRLLKELGSGGMGAVYLAEQTAPVRRQVALKVIKPGMDSREVIARFEAERQALAMMDHHNIARVLDAGTTEQGRPYFVMELVEGESITAYCVGNKLGLRERLSLFIDVCRAVQHAHQKAVIHRDLKPSNILVAVQDGEPVVKVIDFGVAKALSQPLTEAAVVTQHSQMIGTPLYMSPEQAEFGGQDIDTRSDVYSLGVVLYELLTGTTPISRGSLSKVGVEGIRQLMKDRDALRPSSRFSSEPTASDGFFGADWHGRDRRSVAKQIKGELDWIVMKALERNVDNRYAAAGDLADDVDRFLAGVPVEAHPPSRLYVVRKAAARYKALLTTSLVVLVALFAATAVSVWFAVDARRARAGFESLLYAAHMKLASDAIQRGDSPRALELLERYAPRSKSTDQRGFEWYYFHKSVTPNVHASVKLDKSINDLDLSPDGRRMAAATEPGTLAIIDTSNWTVVQTMVLPIDSINGVDWSPNGKQIAAACSDGKIRIWQSSADQPLIGVPQSIDAHAGHANDVLFSPNGSRIYSGGDDSLVKAWHSSTHQKLLEFSGYERWVARLALSPDNSRLATASADGSMRVWNAQNGDLKNKFRYSGRSERVTCVEFSPNGRWLAGATIRGDVFIVDLDSSELRLFTKQADGVEALAFAESGSLLATADRGGVIKLFDVRNLSKITPENATPVASLTTHSDRATAVLVGQDGGLMISGGRDGALHVFNFELNPTRWYTFRDPTQTDIALGPSNQLFIGGRKISIWDLETRQYIASFASTHSLWRHLDISADGRILAASRPGKLVLFDLESKKPIRSWRTEHKQVASRSREGPGAGQVAISPDGKLVAYAETSWLESVLIYSAIDDEPVMKLAARQCHCLTFSPDSRLLAVSHMNDLRIYDLSNGTLACTMQGHTNPLADAAFSPSGAHIATVGHDRLLKIWDLTKQAEIHSIVADQEVLDWVDYSPDGKTLATVSLRRSIKLWHTATGQPLGELKAESRTIRRILYDSTGSRLVACLGGANVVYDASLSRVHAPEAPIVGGASFTPLEDTRKQRIFQSDARAAKMSVGEHWHEDHWRAFRRASDELQYLSPPPKYRHAQALSSLGRHGIVIGRAFNALNDSSGFEPLANSENIVDARPVRWKSQTVEELPGFESGYNWWPQSVSADGRVIVGVRWPLGQNCFETTESTSGIAFRWEAGKVKLLEPLPAFHHSEALGVSGDGRIVVGRLLRRIRNVKTDVAFVWDEQGGVRLLHEVLAIAGANPAGWELQSADATSFDGTTIIGQGLNPEGAKDGWVARLAPHDLRATLDRGKAATTTTAN